MDYLIVLAETIEAGAQAKQGAIQSTTIPIERIWESITSLGILEALTFMSFGAVCVFYGWRVFKVLVVISFSVFGLLLGLTLSDKIAGNGNEPLLGISLAVVLGIGSIPLMRWAVGMLGAIAGGIVTGGAWYALALPEQYIWAGILVGIVAGGMISFIVFRISIMLFSSLGGSGLILMGILALLHHYPVTSEQIQTLVFNAKWFMPLAMMIPTALGLYLQNKFIKSSPNWTI